MLSKLHCSLPLVIRGKTARQREWDQNSSVEVKTMYISICEKKPVTLVFCLIHASFETLVSWLQH